MLNCVSILMLYAKTEILIKITQKCKQKKGKNWTLKKKKIKKEPQGMFKNHW